MKTRFTWLGIVATVILGISSAFVSCENDLGDGHITYKGRVVSQTGNLPMADVTVRITNGTVVRASMMTQADGVFSLSVVVREIDETYYLELLDKNGQSKKGQLRAFGATEYDYGDIPFSNATPEVEIVEIISITPNSFTIKCNATSSGNSPITEKGICWGTNIPTIDNNVVKNGSGVGIYTCTANGGIDISSTTYYACAYAKNEYGTAYSEVVEINSNKLIDFLPDIQTIGITAMTENSFTCKCEVKFQGGTQVKERGVCWSTSIPTISDNKEISGSGQGIFYCTIAKGINIQTTTYYARAYAINESGVAYGDVAEINSNKLEYFSLPTMRYAGYTYHIHPDLGAMSWSAGNQACENLVAYGYSDWYLPDAEELIAIAQNTEVLDKNMSYWTGNEPNVYWSWYVNYAGGAWGVYSLYQASRSLYRIIPVRKD